jgi:hypothetical protein
MLMNRLIDIPVLSKGRITIDDVNKHLKGDYDYPYEALELIFKKLHNDIVKNFDFVKGFGTRSITTYIDPLYFKAGFSLFIFDMHIGFMWDDNLVEIAHIEVLPEDEEAEITDVSPVVIDSIEGVTSLDKFIEIVTAYVSQFDQH